MNAQLHAGEEGQFFIHAQGENANHFRAGRCEPADEQDGLQLKPIAMLLNDG